MPDSACLSPHRRRLLGLAAAFAVVEGAGVTTLRAENAKPSPPSAQGGRKPSYLEFGPGGAGQGNAAADTACLKAAFAAGGAFTIPAGQPVLLNRGVTATGWIDVEGAGGAAPLVLAPDFPPDEDVITLKPQLDRAGNSFVGWRLAALTIKPQVNGRGRDGIVIDHTAHPYTSNAELIIERVAVGDVVGTALGDITVGGYALRYIPHPTDPDGLYCSTIRNNFFVGGVVMRRAGDSLIFSGNWVKGRNIAFDIEFVRGAANATFENNNCTAVASFRLKNGFRCRIVSNQCEMISQWASDHRGPEALVILEDCNGTTIEGNNLGADVLDHSKAQTADCIHLLGTTTRTLVRGDNRLVCNPQRGRVHLRTAASTLLTTVEPGALTQTSTLDRTPWITAIEVPSSVRGLWSPLLPLPGWVSADNQGLRFRTTADGTVNLDGQVRAGPSPAASGAAGPIAMLPVGARPARPFSVLAFVSRGAHRETGVVMIQPDGTIRLNAQTTSSAIVSIDNAAFVAEAN